MGEVAYSSSDCHFDKFGTIGSGEDSLACGLANNWLCVERLGGRLRNMMVVATTTSTTSTTTRSRRGPRRHHRDSAGM